MNPEYIELHKKALEYANKKTRRDTKNTSIARDKEKDVK